MLTVRTSLLWRHVVPIENMSHAHANRTIDLGMGLKIGMFGDGLAPAWEDPCVIVILSSGDAQAKPTMLGV